jgi:hypothetical protein
MPAAGQIDTIPIYIGQQWPYWAGYIQDDFRVNSKLTINYGLSLGSAAATVESKDRWSDFDPTRPNPSAGGIPGALIYAGEGPGPRRDNGRWPTRGGAALAAASAAPTN